MTIKQTAPESTRIRPKPLNPSQPQVNSNPNYVHLKQPDINLEHGLNSEWLVTNGIGGYGMGAMIGARTRHYHGLLVAALEPPLGRHLTVAQLIETITLPGGRLEYLHTQEWGGGGLDPQGYKNLESFTLDGSIPTWRYDFGNIKLEKRLWMKAGQNTTFVTYTLTQGKAIKFELKPLCTFRDHHGGNTSGTPQVKALNDGLEVQFSDAPSYFIRSSFGEHDISGEWWFNQFLRVEAERGFDAIENLYRAGSFSLTLEQNQTLAVCISTHADASASNWTQELEAEQQHSSQLKSKFEHEPTWIQQLAIAADQFIVARGAGHTVIAGYPWFGDWGRDTMIALPGLMLVAGVEVAASILRTFGQFVDKGMLPNRFPDNNETPEYNTVDATLWYVEAIRAYVVSSRDTSIVDELWDTLESIVRWHINGTRYGIGVDPSDGLLRAGEPGVQLTWMDAKIGDWVVTPRTGKPVEINALWFNALRTLEGWANSSTRKASHDYTLLADRVSDSFIKRYWNKATGYMFDVIDTPDGDDGTIRPNAVIAASLMHSPIGHSTRQLILKVAAEKLLTPYGLRSLAPEDSRYAGRYRGSPLERDGVYHQGTVWAWLIGAFVSAHLQAYGDKTAARAFLEPMAQHLLEGGLGSVSEILDGDAPFTPRGCPWQAWSVAEILRAWKLTAPSEKPKTKNGKKVKV